MISPDFRKAAQHTILYALERQEALDEALTDALGKYRWDLDLSRHQITWPGVLRRWDAEVCGTSSSSR
ncbi:hypothetical protein ACT3SQ_06330 [Brachybacterium sp. AOP42-C2-15]|uniref:hypothetical protein n=1 Tax=unclassified Brachybacterium TaxID=2623841 RepID=UPI003F8FA1FA